MQATLGGDLRVDLAQRAGGGVARIDVGALAGGLGGCVERGEIIVPEVDLAAHLDDVRPAVARQTVRELADGLQVLRDVLADAAVTTGGALRQHAVLVAQRGREAVDLRLGGVGHSILSEAQEAANPGVELPGVVVGKGVVER
jgi:hypothetical protein